VNPIVAVGEEVFFDHLANVEFRVLFPDIMRKLCIGAEEGDNLDHKLNLIRTHMRLRKRYMALVMKKGDGAKDDPLYDWLMQIEVDKDTMEYFFGGQKGESDE